MFDDINTYQLLAYAVLPTLFAIVVHEVAHGWVAYRLGDRTAYMMGRLTLNPIKHIDPVGTILVPALLVFTLGFAFGWAKPVPINWAYLKNPKRDIALVAIAGPASNLLMAIAWALLVKLSTLLPESFETISTSLRYMGLLGVLVNVLLMVFNLIPIPPTDGGRIAVSLLPDRAAMLLSKLEPFGFLILFALIFSGLLWQFITPLMNFATAFIYTITGLG